MAFFDSSWDVCTKLLRNYFKQKWLAERDAKNLIWDSCSKLFCELTWVWMQRKQFTPTYWVSNCQQERIKLCKHCRSKLGTFLICPTIFKNRIFSFLPHTEENFQLDSKAEVAIVLKCQLNTHKAMKSCFWLFSECWQADKRLGSLGHAAFGLTLWTHTSCEIPVLQSKLREVPLGLSEVWAENCKSLNKETQKSFWMQASELRLDWPRDYGCWVMPLSCVWSDSVVSITTHSDP